MATEISEGVFLIDTLAAGLPGSVASYLIRGDKCALVDSGFPTSAGTVLSELKAVVGDLSRVEYLIPTHVHLDHAGAVGRLANAVPEAKVLVSEHGTKHLVDPTRLVRSAADLFGDEAMSKYGVPVPLPSERVQAVRDPTILDLGSDKKLRIFWTPGHAWHHMSVFLENERFLVTGDAAGLRYPDFDFPVPATPPPGFEADQYVKTITSFLAMDPAGLLLPHFGPVHEKVRHFLESNLETINHWVSLAFQVVRAGQSRDQVFESFILDIANRSGRARKEIPDRVTGTIMLSAAGCYAYAQERTEKEYRI